MRPSGPALPWIEASLSIYHLPDGLRLSPKQRRIVLICSYFKGRVMDEGTRETHPISWYLVTQDNYGIPG